MIFKNKIRFYIFEILAIFWTFLMITFLCYQINNEEQHIKEMLITEVKDTSRQANDLIFWAFEQKVKAKEEIIHSDIEFEKRSLHKEKENTPLFKQNFSLRDLVYSLNQKPNRKLKIDGIYDKIDYEDDKITSEEILKIEELQNTKKEITYIYKEGDKKYLKFYKPLISDETCIKCHIHSDKKVGDYLGNFNINIQIPKLFEYSIQSFYFYFITYFITWFIGIILIIYLRNQNKIFLKRQKENFEETMFTLISLIEQKDSYTAGHSKRVAEYRKSIAEELKLPLSKIENIYKGGILHDIGKVAIPDEILLKPSKLTDEEYEIIKNHPKMGFESLSGEFFKEFLNIILFHHERWDGKGYPSGLKKDEIPIEVQIITIADAFDAMNSTRTYRKKMSLYEILDELQKCSGTQFSPHIIDVAIKVFKRLEDDIFED